MGNAWMQSSALKIPRYMGGLNKPTICLLGNKADWRWLTNKEEKYSYWYPTVRIAWQDEGSSSWEKALGEVQDWIRGLDIV